MRTITTATLALGVLAGLGVGLDSAAFAQGSTGAPAGQPGATAPGGTEGAAALSNEQEAIRSGEAIPATPGTGVPIETAPPPAGEHHRTHSPRP